MDSQMRESPPPLPARLQSQLAKQRKENGEVLMMAKKWEDKSLRDGDKIQKIWTPQAKKWPVEIENAHTKIQTSHSLPPNHGGFSLPAGTANSSTGR